MDRASDARPLAFSAFSAVARTILDISSSEVLVSSTEDACSLAPEARAWLAIDTCRAAEAVCSEPWSRFCVILARAWFVERMISHASSEARSKTRIRDPSMRRTLRGAALLLVFARALQAFE